MKVRDLKPRDIIDVMRGESLRAAAKHLADDDIGAVAVFDSTGAVGVLSERDLARAVADGGDLDDTPVDDYMTEAPIKIEADSAIGGAVAKMNEFGVRHLLVDDQGDVTGMISMRDVVALLGTRWPEL